MICKLKFNRILRKWHVCLLRINFFFGFFIETQKNTNIRYQSLYGSDHEIHFGLHTLMAFFSENLILILASLFFDFEIGLNLRKIIYGDSGTSQFQIEKLHFSIRKRDLIVPKYFIMRRSLVSKSIFHSLFGPSITRPAVSRIFREVRLRRPKNIVGALYFYLWVSFNSMEGKFLIFSIELNICSNDPSKILPHPSEKRVSPENITLALFE